MPDLITLSCPACGGSLEINKGLERFACAHCGTEHIVKRGGGTISVEPIVEGISKVQIGVDKTASELAIKRLQEELQTLRTKEQGLARKIPTGGFSGVSFVLAVFTLVLSAGAICNIVGSDNWLLTSVFFASAFFVGFLTIVLSVSAKNTAKRRSHELRDELQELRKVIRRKSEELERHEELVSQQS